MPISKTRNQLVVTQRLTHRYTRAREDANRIRDKAEQLVSELNGASLRQKNL